MATHMADSPVRQGVDIAKCNRRHQLTDGARIPWRISAHHDSGQEPIKKSKQGQSPDVDVVTVFADLTMTKQIVNDAPVAVRHGDIAEEEKPNCAASLSWMMIRRRWRDG